MKKIREVNGKLVAYIQKSDIDTLYASRDFVRKEIFSEPDIVHMECDSEGYYRIGDPENAKYIADLGYIPDYDVLSKLSKEEIGAMADKVLADRYKIDEIIKKLCQYKEKLTWKERRILKKADYLNPHYVEILEGNVLEASLAATLFGSMEEALFAQIRNYTDTLIKLAEQPTLPSHGSKRKQF